MRIDQLRQTIEKATGHPFPEKSFTLTDAFDIMVAALSNRQHWKIGAVIYAPDFDIFRLEPRTRKQRKGKLVQRLIGAGYLAPVNHAENEREGAKGYRPTTPLHSGLSITRLLSMNSKDFVDLFDFRPVYPLKSIRIASVRNYVQETLGERISFYRRVRLREIPNSAQRRYRILSWESHYLRNEHKFGESIVAELKAIVQQQRSPRLYEHFIRCLEAAYGQRETIESYKAYAMERYDVTYSILETCLQAFNEGKAEKNQISIDSVETPPFVLIVDELVELQDAKRVALTRIQLNPESFELHAPSSSLALRNISAF